MIAPTSRYAGHRSLTYTAANGDTIRYLSRRFVPQPSAIQAAGTVTVEQADRDRLDLVTARALHQQPELFWQIADANAAMDPFDLTSTPGLRLRVPAPRV
ncbi:MAG TPA: hypothetical protein VN999_17200 [Thermoanaerobaculia bacterium]|nr:hypothetical protein [Thermoanaerobaculia bacterium]